MLSEASQSRTLGLGPDEIGQKGLNLFYLWNHSKHPKPKTTKLFFIADVKISQVFWAFRY